MGTDGEKNINWIDTDIRLTVIKNIDKIDVFRRKKILFRWFDFIGEKKNLGTDD